MGKEHGIIVTESPTSLAVPVEGTAGLQVVFGTAPINMSPEPENAVNTPVLAYSFGEAAGKLGYSEDWEKYTLCQSMDAAFRVFNVSPIIFVNVLDPEKHKKSVSEETINVENKQAAVKKEGILLKSIVIKKGSEELKELEDYILGFDSSGYVVITMTDTGKGTDASTIQITYDELDPSKVTNADVIGGYDVATGKETGIELLRQIYPKFNMAPGLLLAPGWSHKTDVGAVLQAKCEKINGLFRCNCILDLDTSTAQKYTDVKEAKENSGFVDEDAIVVWPMVKSGGKKYYYSAIYAAMTAFTDVANDDVTSLSPSNKLLKIGGACLSDGTEVNLDQQQANVVNGYGVVTVLNQNGWRSWGNNTAAYPGVSDVKDIWICVRRMFSWHSNSFVLTYINKVDDPANYRLIESIVDSENIRCNALTPDKWAGAKIEFRAEDNPITGVLGGKMKFKQYISPYVPAEVIENDLEYDVDMLEAALGGGQ